VLDLTQVREAVGAPVHFTESADLLSDSIQKVHNLNIDAETGFAYVVIGLRKIERASASPARSSFPGLGRTTTCPRMKLKQF
jgi:hypothetical protein